MAEPTAMRVFRALQSPLYAACRSGVRAPALSQFRPFSQTTHTDAARPTKADTQGSMNSMLANVSGNLNLGSAIPPRGELDGDIFVNLAKSEWEEPPRHHLHIYCHKHNTHITLTTPDRDPIISVSCGNIGFRKAGRGTYDAAYQLAAFVMNRIRDKGLLPQIQRLELVYRGFGAGREAVTKAILGSEGSQIRHLVVRLADSTRLKFGGVRSKKPRRLG
ncbi:mitochondrial ribosomal protein-like protein subunit S18 [Sporormia fimetaria CBS 119925]|uniref:Small ribosomal subunit protein uS11m n=1 Tax=Sporormia fimetaria CBS 119925 TaxID=1340428 RepID=A0A6A6V791_9PLEO|nr:mitochondrial ribosomal protein-like protein subunit S18 [Sporormia fimetaria CBS 119925]